MSANLVDKCQVATLAQYVSPECLQCLEIKVPPGLDVPKTAAMHIAQANLNSVNYRYNESGNNDYVQACIDATRGGCNWPLPYLLASPASIDKMRNLIGILNNWTLQSEQEPHYRANAGWRIVNQLTRSLLLKIGKIV